MATKISVPDTQHRSAHQSSPNEDDQISFLDLLIAVLERKRLVFAVTVIFAVLGVVISLVWPTRYTATTTILPPQQSSSMAAALASQLGTMGGMAALAGSSLGLKSPNDMLVSMLKSRTVEDAMIEHFGLVREYRARYVSDARKALESHVTIDGSGKDGLIRISITDRDAHRAAELTNGYVDQFRNLSANLAITEASQRRLFFETELKTTKDKLASAEEALKRTEQQSGLIELSSQARALIESVAALRAQITAKEVQIKSLETYAADQNAQLVQAEQELESLRSQLAKLESAGDGTGSSLILPHGKVPEAGLEYVRKLRDVKYYETIFEILARQYEMAKLDEAKQGSLIQVIDPAIPPDRRSSPQRALITAAFTVIGVFGAILLALLQAGLKRMKEDAATGEKLSMVGDMLIPRRFRRNRLA